eukprot:COSAG04_NODE_2767_length_3616_cov_1.412568_7_plen_81_part_00
MRCRELGLLLKKGRFASVAAAGDTTVVKFGAASFDKRACRPVWRLSLFVPFHHQSVLSRCFFARSPGQLEGGITEECGAV